MAIRDAARDAWVAARSDREGEARARLAEVLTPFDVAQLDTVDVQVTEAFTLFVFHDAEDDVHLAVRSREGGWDVHVVVEDGGWTISGPPVTSLAHLHEVLPEPEPEPEEPEVLPWTQGVVYRIGDRVTHKGHVWEAVQGDGAGNNSWEPGTYGWQQVTD